MNIITEQRENIILNNNTAQNSFIYILENMNKQTDTIHIKNILYGDLDFKIMGEMGFGLVKRIIINKGEITNILNLPNSILHFECVDNLLINIENLPVSIETLILESNYIENIELSNLTKLNTLNISHNKLTVLERFPKTIQSLNCQNNYLQRIDLDGITKLTNLNISNNQITIVENLPDNLVEFLYDNNPTIEFRNKSNVVEIPSNVKIMEDDNKLKYVEALHEYFKLKNKYMDKLRELKHKTFKNAPNKRAAQQRISLIKMPCIKCKRKVGTIFQTKDNRHIAICGDKVAPCSLNIQLFNGGDNIHILNLLNDLKITVDELKGSIIQHRLDTLFSYISEEESLKIYQNELNEFNDVSIIHKEYLDMYNDLYNNENTKALILKKNQNIFHIIERNRDILKEYANITNETTKRELIQNVVHTQIEQLIPETRNVSLLKYGIQEIITEELKPNVFIHQLYQLPVDPQRNFVYMKEEPSIISFVK